jgi:hypothetical protein
MMKRFIVLAVLLFSTSAFAQPTERIWPTFTLPELEIIQRWEKETAPKICPWVFTIGGTVFAFSSEYNATLFWNWAVANYGMVGFSSAASPVGWGLFAAAIAAPISYAAGYGVCTMFDKGRLELDIMRAKAAAARAEADARMAVLRANDQLVEIRKSLYK